MVTIERLAVQPDLQRLLDRDGVDCGAAGRRGPSRSTGRLRVTRPMSIILTPPRSPTARSEHGPEALAERAVRGLQTPRAHLDHHTIRTVLDLARDAAHEIERPAAPLTTFLVGVAVGRGASLDARRGTALALLLGRHRAPPSDGRARRPGAGAAHSLAEVRRLWLRWAGLVVFVVVLGVVFVNLGQWQLDRLDQRRERNSATVANEQQAGAAVRAEVFTGEISDADQWQRVEARGTFDAEHQFVVRYRSNGDDRRIRGGHAAAHRRRCGAGGPRLRGHVAGWPDPRRRRRRPPAGEVTVVGHVRRNEQGRRAAITPVDGQMRLINSDAIGARPRLPGAERLHRR